MTIDLPPYACLDDPDGLHHIGCGCDWDDDGPEHTDCPTCDSGSHTGARCPNREDHDR